MAKKSVVAESNELLELAHKKERKGLTGAEQTRLTAIQEALLAQASKTPLAHEMTQVYQLGDILKADGAKLHPEEAITIHMALLQAGKHRLTLFSALKSIQRTHLSVASHIEAAN